MSDTPSKTDEFKRGWAVLLAATLGSACGLSSLPYYSLGLFIAPLQAEFGWSRGQVASAFLYSTIVLAIVAPIMGSVIDRVGSRLVALVSIPLFAAVFVVLSRFNGALALFYALYAVSALVGAGTSPINYTRAVNQVFDKARGLALGISQAGIAVAAIALPLFLVVVIKDHGWRAGYFALAMLMLVPWLFVLFGLGKRRAHDNAPAPAAPAWRAANAGVEAGGHSGLFRSGVFWTVGLSFAAAALAVSGLVVHMVPLMRDLGMDPVKAASTAAIIGVGVLVGRLLTGYLIDRFFAPYVAATLFALTAAGCLVLLYGGPGVAVFAAALIGLSLGAEADLIAYLTARYFGMAHYAKVYGYIYSMFALGAAAGPALAGAAYDLNRNYTMAIWGVIALLLLASFSISRLPKFDQHESPLSEAAPATT